VITKVITTEFYAHSYRPLDTVPLAVKMVPQKLPLSAESKLSRKLMANRPGGNVKGIGAANVVWGSSSATAAESTPLLGNGEQ
jgi:hypothetical protein